MCRVMGQSVEGGGGLWTPIYLGTYNIRNRWNGNLELALRGVGQSNLDVAVFQDTKLTDDIYTRRSVGYKVIVMPAPSRNRGSIVIFY